MSHTTKLNGVEIRDITALEAAINQLASTGVNIALKQNAKPRMHTPEQANRLGVCPYVISLPGCSYDIGLKKDGDVYKPHFDTWQNKVGSQIGAACKIPSGMEGEGQIGKLLQEYAVQATLNAARQQGHTVLGIKTNAQGERVVRLRARN